MEYGVVNVSAASVRKKPNHKKEMTNQLLFGEKVQILKEKGDYWIKIKSLHDDYEGWMASSFIKEISKEEVLEVDAVLVSGLINTIQLRNKSYFIPMGAALPSFINGAGIMAETDYEYVGDSVDVATIQPSAGYLMQLVEKWLDVPYLWGGRTFLGVDCSGLVQVVYKLMGIPLPRDAWQQAQMGYNIKKIGEAVCGDLAFFDDEREVVHVGILLNNETIIHSSGKVRIDKIDKKGIIHSETGKRTHQLKAIKRIW